MAVPAPVPGRDPDADQFCEDGACARSVPCASTPGFAAYNKFGAGWAGLVAGRPRAEPQTDVTVLGSSDDDVDEDDDDDDSDSSADGEWTVEDSGNVGDWQAGQAGKDAVLPRDCFSHMVRGGPPWFTV